MGNQIPEKIENMPNTEHRPDIVFVVLDTHRLDRLGCYGYSRRTTPNIDAFSRQATLFENAISPAQWTIPVHASWFTGEPPSTHMTVQSGDVLDTRFRTLAECLRTSGYHTVGFCNNPLVGVINNGFKRGFEAFYNYSGAVQSGFRPAEHLPRLVRDVWYRYRKVLRRITDPIQNLFATSNQVFQAALNPFWVPLWTRFAHFKGDTPRSIRDVARFVRQRMAVPDRSPYFLFLNLMEPHLPYSPPERFVREFVPYLREEREARNFMHAFNTQAMRWLIPLDRPYSELEAETLSDMYDAEVAYQDDMLAELFEVLDEPTHREDTAVIVVADHGEMLGEHQLMGHGFGVYQELIHVPLLVRLPGQASVKCVTDLVSTLRLFATVLDLAGEEAYESACGLTMDVRSQSLAREAHGVGKADPVACSEAYAPEFALKIIERHRPQLIDRLYCRATNWAACEEALKLIRVEGVRDDLFALKEDPREAYSLNGTEGDIERRRLGARLDGFVEKAVACRPSHGVQRRANLDDEVVRQRLRGLGYIE
jgi:arylsulfatase A-like enzyme